MDSGRIITMKQSGETESTNGRSSEVVISFWRRSAIRLSLGLCGCVAAFLTCEVAIRVHLSATAKITTHPHIDILPDSKRVYTLRKSLAPPIGTNSAGFRGEEIPLHKDSATYRILMLGDSITFGNQVSWNETFSYHLQTELNAKAPNRRFEVLNLGVSGYNSAQQEATLREVGLAYSPDLVVLNVCLNDSDPVKDVSSGGLINKTAITRISDINVRTIINSSRALTLLKKTAVRHFGGDTFSVLNSPTLVLNSRVKEAAWEEMKKAMSSIYERCRNNKIPLAVVIYPYNSQLPLSDEELLPQKDLVKFWRGLSVPVLDAVPFYRSAEDDMFNDGYVHLSVYGHQRVAKAIRSKLEESRLLPR